MSDLPIFPGLFQSDNDAEIVDDFTMTRDMLSLKGQIWPGMGKMDLANDEMKRTRNQRKPKSVVEKMRRTSEGIEPTQVVMTSQFNIERIKGVYDEDSPVSDQEEPVSSSYKKPIWELMRHSRLHGRPQGRSGRRQSPWQRSLSISRGASTDSLPVITTH